ncbi:uncharacterized protein LOC143637582 [Bidens hawaiensis]|uniref:uncharacterized protein LOC143637582 n=1 Tax=Bidens hawaiensis TaxID=980011 RepID=UPI00404A8F28
MAADSKVTLTLKLLIDKKDKHLLFAEAGKDFVDFPFSLLVLPVGTVMGILDKRETIGGLSKVYKSISNLNNDYLQSNETKDVLLKPKSMLPLFSDKVPLPNEAFESESTYPTVLYTCINGCNIGRTMHTHSIASGKCTYCRTELSATKNPYDLKPIVNANGGGFVKGPVTYMVMDDLVVSPMPTTTFAGMNLFNKFNIKDLDSLEEKIVRIGPNEGLEILNHSLSSKTVLTDVFLRGGVADRNENPTKRCKTEC